MCCVLSTCVSHKRDINLSILHLHYLPFFFYETEDLTWSSTPTPFFFSLSSSSVLGMSINAYLMWIIQDPVMCVMQRSGSCAETVRCMLWRVPVYL